MTDVVTSERDARKLVERWRKYYPEIVGTWHSLEDVLAKERVIVRRFVDMKTETAKMTKEERKQQGLRKDGQWSNRHQRRELRKEIEALHEGVRDLSRRMIDLRETLKMTAEVPGRALYTKNPTVYMSQALALDAPYLVQLLAKVGKSGGSIKASDRDTLIEILRVVAVACANKYLIEITDQK